MRDVDLMRRTVIEAVPKHLAIFRSEKGADATVPRARGQNLGALPVLVAMRRAALDQWRS